MKQTLAGYRIYEQAKIPFMHPMLFGRSLSNERSEGDKMPLEPLLLSFADAASLPVALKQERRHSEPVRIGLILPDVMVSIRRRMDRQRRAVV